jgi:hypothetical protein
MHQHLKRKLEDLPDGLRNRMIRLTFEYAVLSGKDPEDRVRALHEHFLTSKMWRTRSYHLMLAVNKQLLLEGKPVKYVFTK